MQALDIRDFEIERRLDALARARLSPDPQAVARARARVMREARLQFEAARIAAHVVPAVTLASRRSTARRLAMPLLAASLWLGIAVGSVAASGAGGPLYPARLWVETVTLATNPAERAAAEVARLDARLADALSAAARGDSSAVAAALAAYRQIADETIAASTGNDDLEAIVAAALDRHRVVLTAVADSLESKGATTAAAAVETTIQRAIEHNETVVAGFATTGDGQPSGGGSGTGATDQGATGGGGGTLSTGTSTGGAAGAGSGGAGGAGATGGSAGNAGAPADGGANAGGGGAVNTGGGQDGGKGPTKETKPTPTADASAHGGQGPNE